MLKLGTVGLENNGLHLHQFLVFGSSFFLSHPGPIPSSPELQGFPSTQQTHTAPDGEESWNQVGK